MNTKDKVEGTGIPFETMMAEFFRQMLAGEFGVSQLRAFLEHKAERWHVLKIDRKYPCGLFLGSNGVFTKWEEPLMDVTGKDFGDAKSIAVSEVDFEKVTFVAHVGGTRERLRWHAKDGDILADAQIGVTLYEEMGQKTLRYLYEKSGVTNFILAGTPMYSEYPIMRFLVLERQSHGSWMLDISPVSGVGDMPFLVLPKN